MDKDVEEGKLQVRTGEKELERGSSERGLQKASKWDAGEALGESAARGHLRNAGGGEGYLQEGEEMGRQADQAPGLEEGALCRAPGGEGRVIENP